MKKLSMVILFVASLFLPLAVQAQESTQLRAIVHVRFFPKSESKGSGLFLTGWSITNAMSNAKDTSNIFFGIGYAGKNWSIENMVWKQWSTAGNTFSLDWRITAKPAKRLAMYFEIAPRLDKRALYDFVTADVHIIGPFSLGGETENIHRPGKDTIGFGPRIFVQSPWKIAGAKPAIAVSRQFRTLGPNVNRLYTILNWVF